MPGKQWTETEIRLVNELAAEGHANAVIAKALNRTAQAVANKKISIRDPGYYLRAQAKADMPEAFAYNEALNKREANIEAAFIVAVGTVVFAVLSSIVWFAGGAA